MGNRLLQEHGRFNAQYLIPNQVGNLTDEIVQEMHQEFLMDLNNDFEVFRSEVSRWNTRWSNVTPDNAPNTLKGAIARAPTDLYPNVLMCMAVLPTMPVSTATAERSFSIIKRVKSYLRNTMTIMRLSGLGLLNIYREMQLSAE